MRHATSNGAKYLRPDGKTGPLTAGKEADIVMPNTTMLNVAPLNTFSGAVVSLMDRTNASSPSRSGKSRCSVAMPTPARREISGIEMSGSEPSSAARATARSFSRSRSASTRLGGAGGS
nr:hypothetical protein [Prauserella shujinwangii]